MAHRRVSADAAMRRAAIIGGTIALAADLAYLALIHSQQGADGSLRVPFVVSIIAVSGVVALTAGALGDSTFRELSLAFAAGTTLVVGFLALFDIGLLLLAAGALMGAPVVRSASANLKRRLPAAMVGAAAAIAVAIGGFEWTSYPVTCPVAGNASGTGTTFLGGSYTWSCHGGSVTVGKST